MADMPVPDFIKTVTDEESLPENFSKPPSLWDNRMNSGQNPTIEPTSATEPRDLFVIGNRGQEGKS